MLQLKQYELAQTYKFLTSRGISNTSYSRDHIISLIQMSYWISTYNSKFTDLATDLTLLNSRIRLLKSLIKVSPAHCGIGE